MITSVMVSYNPDSEITGNITSISSQCLELIIVDNGSSEKWWEKLQIPPRVKIIALDYNYGIAHATNIGIVNSCVDSKWFALFDQDTSIDNGYFEMMLENIEKSGDLDTSRVGLIAPSFGGLKISSSYEIGAVKEIKTAIASGSMIKRSALKNTGLMDDLLFIDYVDNDFCFRLMSEGYLVVEAEGIRLSHSLGKMSPHRIGKWQFHTSNHSPLRKYYVFRNRIYIYRNYIYRYPVWVFRDFFRNITEILKIAMWEEDKSEKFYFIRRGISDGLAGRFGKYNSKPGSK
ncbi:glycosyltransferase [Deinococcus aquaticus]|uniref:Glycosyltransferase n=2 Tax=Deinococcus aquaticus TaxID=328692 RepID=A0ABY7V256_9DEIO|nr:glycosyltransferase [Deinococcus aquaticus]WDA59269.1 glycosyltransferase [Deinococcus aquaticus]